MFTSFEETYGDDFKYKLSNIDTGFCLDSYWVQICLKNLVENAFKHGEKPVSASVSFENNKLLLSVKDEGVAQFDCLEKMTDEFVKGNKSSGTGLGLNIVKKVIKEMGGKLKYSNHPTVFTIELKKKKQKSEV
jgi:signal transduction histidine kinase